MRILCFEDPALFWRRAASFLLAEEAVYNLSIGTILQTMRKPGCYGPGVFMALVEEKSTLVGAAIMTPGLPVILTHCSRGAVALIVDAMVRQYLPVNGVVGPPKSASLFADFFNRAQPGSKTRRDKEMRIYRLDDVVMPKNSVPGRMTLGRMAQIEIATDYLEDFFRVSHLRKRFDTKKLAQSTIKEKRLLFWETTEPVSMAVWVRETPHAKAVGYVYTPTIHEGNGYATHLVAQMSRQALEAGLAFTVLYADLDNPIPNHIYQKIGYRPVGEACQMDISFSARADAPSRCRKHHRFS